MSLPGDPSRRPRILIVDDEDSIRILLVRLLRRAGFEPDEATDGEAAIERLKAGAFDAIVLDLTMPRVDGFGVVAHLLETHPSMLHKTIVLTAFPKWAAEKLKNHVSCILSKPFDTGELVALVQECAGR